MTLDSTDSHEFRTSIIQSVRTPLGFFTLAVLITEVILGLLASKASGGDFTILVVSMVILMFVLVGIVAYLSFSKPYTLINDTYPAKREPSLLQPVDNSLPLEEQNSILRKENEQLKNELSRFNSLQTQVWAALHRYHTVKLEEILSYLGINNDPKARGEVISILGMFLQDGKIKRDEVNAQSFVPRK
jgi:hypothetical protein